MNFAEILFLFQFLNTINAYTSDPPVVLTAYDCSLPSVTKSYSVLEYSDCQAQQREQYYKGKYALRPHGNAFMLVLQKKQFIHLKMKSCHIYSTANLNYCGYSAIHYLISETIWVPRHISHFDCSKLWEGRSLTLDNFEIRGIPNREHHVQMKVGIGKTTSGTCGGNNYKKAQAYNGQIYKNAIGYIGYKIILENTYSAFDLTATMMLTPYEFPCNIKKHQYCYFLNMTFATGVSQSMQNLMCTQTL